MTSIAAHPRQMLARLDRAGARVVDLAIRAYQRWLSPLKGPNRACAHRVLHGGDSCSQHVRGVIAERGLVASVPRVVQRFHACRDAAADLHRPRGGGVGGDDGSTPTPAANRFRRRGQCCIVIPLPTCSTTRTFRG